MTRFVSDVLDVPRQQVEGVEADLFGFADGSSFAVASPGGMGDSARSLGFLVERYVHFTGPDGHLYELVERF